VDLERELMGGDPGMEEHTTGRLIGGIEDPITQKNTKRGYIRKDIDILLTERE